MKATKAKPAASRKRKPIVAKFAMPTSKSVAVTQPAATHLMMIRRMRQT